MKTLKPFIFFRATLTILLTLSLAALNPALALREEQNEPGSPTLAELSSAILGPQDSPQSTPTAGLEEDLTEAFRPSRRDFSRASLAGLLGGFLGLHALVGPTTSPFDPATSPFEVSPHFLPVGEIGAPWKELFEVKADRPALPFFGFNEFFTVRLPGEEQNQVVGLRGESLGSTDTYTTNTNMIINPWTGEIIGSYNSYMQATGFQIHNRYGKPAFDFEFSLIIHPRSARRDLFPTYLEPLYKVLERWPDRQLKRVQEKPIGYLYSRNDERFLLDEAGQPIARLEWVRILRGGKRQWLGYLDRASLTHRLFTGPPTKELLEELRWHLRILQPVSLQAKLLRTQLAMRLVQVDLLLGGKEGGRFREIRIDPEEARKTAAALKSEPLTALNDFERPQTQQLLWSAIGGLHPTYRIYVEGVRLAGHEWDPELLESIVRILRSAHRSSRERKPERREGRPLDQSLLSIWIDGLRFQAVQTPVEAARFMADFPESKNPSNESWIFEFLPLRVNNEFTSLEKSAHQAAALQRGGLQVNLCKLQSVRIIDPNTKTVSTEFLAVVKDPGGGSSITVLGSDSLLDPSGGRRLTAGAYRFDSRDSFFSKFGNRVAYEIPMAQVLSAQASAMPWSQEIQRRLQMKSILFLEDPEVSDLFRIGFSGGTFSYLHAWDGFSSQAEEKTIRSGQRAFVKTVRERGIRVLRKLPGGRIVPFRVGELETPESLRKHQAALGESFRILPSRMFRGLHQITLQVESELGSYSSAQIRYGKVEVRKERFSPQGTAGKGEVTQSSQDIGTAVHELLHSWDFTSTEPYRIGGRSQTLPGLFKQISWEQLGNTSWRRRTGDQASWGIIYWNTAQPMNWKTLQSSANTTLRKPGSFGRSPVESLKQETWFQSLNISS